MPTLEAWVHLDISSSGSFQTPFDSFLPEFFRSSDAGSSLLHYLSQKSKKTTFLPEIPDHPLDSHLRSAGPVDPRRGASHHFDQICWSPSESRFAAATIILLYENGESPSLQATGYSLGADAPVRVLSPRQGRKILANRSERNTFSKNLDLFRRHGKHILQEGFLYNA